MKLSESLSSFRWSRQSLSWGLALISKGCSMFLKAVCARAFDFSVLVISELPLRQDCWWLRFSQVSAGSLHIVLRYHMLTWNRTCEDGVFDLSAWGRRHILFLVGRHRRLCGCCTWDERLSHLSNWNVHSLIRVGHLTCWDSSRNDRFSHLS